MYSNGDETASLDPIELSIVIPAFNEAENLDPLIAEIEAVFQDISFDWELIIVNDGSTDVTREVLHNIQKRCPQLRVLSFRVRSRKTSALDAGFRSARGRLIATMDADLQNDPADIPKLMQWIVEDKSDMVNGWRQQRHDNWLRLLSTRIGNGVRNWLTAEQVHDAACGIKVFRKECLENIKLFTGLHRFLPTLMKLEGWRVMEVPVNHRERHAGYAKYGVGNRLFRGLRDTFAVRWMQKRALRYTIDQGDDSDV